MKNSIAGVVAVTALLAAFGSPHEVEAKKTKRTDRAERQLKEDFRASWRRATRMFTRVLETKEARLVRSGRTTTVDAATKIGTGVEVCRTDATDGQVCDPVTKAASHCDDVHCNCAWTGCNNFVQNCVGYGYTEVLCVTNYTEGGYPVGLGCECSGPSF